MATVGVKGFLRQSKLTGCVAIDVFIQVCEDQDIARCKMLQNEMWVCCNLISQTAVNVDEVCYTVSAVSSSVTFE